MKKIYYFLKESERRRFGHIHMEIFKQLRLKHTFLWGRHVYLAELNIMFIRSKQCIYEYEYELNINNQTQNDQSCY